MPLKFISALDQAWLQFTTTSQDIYDPQSFTLDPFCNSWLIVNLGDIWINVNGVLVKGYPTGQPDVAGGSYGVTGNIGEIYKGNVNIQDARNLPGSGTTTFHVLALQKTYNVNF